MTTAKTIHFNIVGDHTMYCQGCVRSIEFTLSRLSDVVKVSADYKAQHIAVQLKDDARINAEAIQAELAWLGYQTEVRP